MADTKLSGLTALTSVATNDYVEVLDVSDTVTMSAATGSNKKVLWSDFMSIGTAVQAFDADLTAFAGLTSAANVFPYYTGSNTMGTADFLNWGTWAATWTALGPGNPGGAGTATYQYAQVGKIVMARYQLVLGITGTVGTNPSISLPVTADTTQTQNVTGHCRMSSGGTVYMGHMAYTTSTTASPKTWNSAATSVVVAGVTATLPGTWAAGDALSGQMIYRAA